MGIGSIARYPRPRSFHRQAPQLNRWRDLARGENRRMCCYCSTLAKGECTPRLFASPLFHLWCHVQCAICETTIQAHDERVVATRDGLLVHIACADHEATVAWASRHRHALMDGCLVLGAISSLWYVLGSVFGVLGAVMGCALHLLRHWHCWQGLAFRVRRGPRVKF